MSATSDALVENVRACSTEEKAELKVLLERALVEDRRCEIKENSERSQAELRHGQLRFSSSINELKKSLAE